MSLDRYQATFGKSPFAGQEGERGGPPLAAPRAPRIRALRRDVFVIYRPLNHCPFCQRQIYPNPNLDTGQMPPLLEDPGVEYLCPHVRRTAYQELLDQEVRKEVNILTSDMTTLSNGTVQVVVSWAIFDVPAKREEA